MQSVGAFADQIGWLLARARVRAVLGYRHRLDDNFGLALVGYGTKIHGAQRGASYRATRIGRWCATAAAAAAATPAVVIIAVIIVIHAR